MPANELKYKTYKNRRVSIIKATKKYYADNLVDTKGNMKKTWSILKKNYQ